MFRARLVAALLAVAAVTAACGSSGSGSSTTGGDAAPSTASSSGSDPEGVPARDVTTDAPFRLVALPSHLKVGERLVLRTTGDTSGGWQGGVDTQVDLKVDGAWRTLWWIVDEDFNSVLQPVGGGAEATVPAKGVDITADVAFVIPPELAPRQYRFCRLYSRSAGNADAYVCAFAFVVKD